MTKLRVGCFAWGVVICFALIGEPWAGVVCTDEKWTDRNGDHPAIENDGSGPILKCYYDTADMWTRRGPKYGNFKIFFNTCVMDPIKHVLICNNEQITEDDVKPIAHFVECAYDLYLLREMAPSSLLFSNPLTSKWMDVTTRSTSDKHIPVWINAQSGGGGASRDPHLSFPAHGRLHDPITANAIHEFGHLIVNGYTWFLGGGYVPMIKEGLPTFFEYVLRDDYRYPEKNDTRQACGGERFINVSIDSLRIQDYCNATPFWHFISSFTLLDDPEYYSTITPACEKYLEYLDVKPLAGKMRRIPGRDVIRAVLEGLSKCYPDARDTPVCSNNNGYAAYCSTEKSIYSSSGLKSGKKGCQPDDDRFLLTDAQKEDSGNARGELMMPLAMDILDNVFRVKNFAGGQNPRFHDGIANSMFRQYLEWNFEQPSAPTTSSVQMDGSKFFIKSFGAHYHIIDISRGAKTVTVSKDADIPKWAYGTFYKGSCANGTCMTAVDGWDNQGYQDVSAWKNRNSDTLTIPSHAGFNKAVVVVTAFEGTYDLAVGYADSGGHYNLHVIP